MVPATTVHATLQGLRAVGADATALARQAGLSPEAPSDPLAVVEAGALGRLWRAALGADPRPHLPALVGAAVPFGAFGLTDHLVGAAPTLGDGLRALADYFRLVSPVARLDVDGAGVWVANGGSSMASATGDAFTLAVIAARFRRPLRASGGIARVDLTYPVALPAEPFEAVFEAPVRLGQSRSGLLLPPEAGAVPLAKPDPALHATLGALASRADVQAYAARPVGYAVRLRLPQALREHAAEVDDIARALHLSPRTLQRRLEAEGTSVRALTDAYRREESARRLARGEPVGRVAAELGYAEPTSFTRAFRRWHGIAPSRWAREARRQRPGA